MVHNQDFWDNRVLEYLQKGKRLNYMDAMHFLKVIGLTPVIERLIEQGHPIEEEERIGVGFTGVVWTHKEYFIKPENLTNGNASTQKEPG